MGELCMRFLAKIVSLSMYLIGFLINILAQILPILDKSVTTIAGIIGIIGGFIYVGILLRKNKQGKIALDNERLDNQIKREQLKKLQNDA